MSSSAHTIRVLSSVLLASVVACGTAPSDPGNTDGGSDATDAGGGAATDAKVRYVVSFGAAPSTRKAFSLTIDGAPVSTSFDTAVMGAEIQADFPGRIAGWASLTPGEHDVKVTATATQTVCQNPPECSQVVEQDRAFEAGATVTATAGSHHLVFAHLAFVVPAPRVPAQPQAQVNVFDVTPPTSGAAIFVRRDAFFFRAEGIDYNWRPASNPCEGSGGIQVPAGGSGTLVVPAETAGILYMKGQDNPTANYAEFPKLREGELYTFMHTAWPPMLAPDEAGARTAGTTFTPECAQ